jgi:uncharacterized protein (UPF0276 family)
MRKLSTDRVGLGWRGELCASIFDGLDSIDVLEVIADDWTNAPRAAQRALRALADERPMIIHGVSLGLASCFSADQRRLDRMARLVGTVRPEAWSEHLAFVRAGGIEIGHLAAPPRNSRSIEGTVANVRRAARIVGSSPALENIATLIEPGASTCGEAEWTCEIIAGSGSPMLLDLHNLYANALNFGRDPGDLLAAMPIESVEMVHLSGGRWLRPAGSRPRLLDDHLHDPPDPVFELLESLAARAPRPLTVIVERDGNFPAFNLLLAQLDRARAALVRGREKAARGGLSRVAA